MSENDGPGAHRVRRDPRAERRSGRERRVPPRPEAPPAELPLRVIDDPACLVLAVPDLSEGKLSSHDRDVIGAARALADALAGAVAVLAIAGEDDFGAAGADRLIEVRGGAFFGYRPEARAAVVTAAIDAFEPRHVLFPDGVAEGGHIGRLVAARLGERAAGDVRRLSGMQIERRGRGGQVDYVMEAPRVLLVGAEAAEPVTGVRHEARLLATTAPEAEARLGDEGLQRIDAGAVPLDEADVIVSAGNGVTDWDAFHRVAAALGATEGGSRVVCDAGFLPRDRQIGASGTLVDPRCYIAFGISGATQHLQGIARCERVVAVNTDLHADMVKRADLAVIADAQAVMPALSKLVEERRRGD